MATSALTTTVRDYWDDGKRVHVVATIGIAAGDYTVGGIAVPLTGLFPGQRSTPLVLAVNGVAGFKYEFVRSTGKLQIRQDEGTAADAPFSELGATATPAAVVADVIDVYMVCKKFV